MTKSLLQNNILFILIALVSIFTATSCKTTKVKGNSKSHVNFMNTSDIDAVIALARSENKLIFMDFYADWCLPCKLMDEEVFSDPDIKLYLEEHFIPVKVESDKGLGYKLATRYLVEGYPTILILDQNGKELVRKLGAAFHKEIYDMGNEAMDSN